jgi:hypothetical protein
MRPGMSGPFGPSLHLELRVRDLALFNLAIDSKLRGCDLVAFRVNDVAPHGYTMDRANVRQRKTGRSVRLPRIEPASFQIEQQLAPIPRAFTRAVSEADKFFAALRRRANQHQNASLLIFESGLQVDAVRPYT